MNLTIYLLVASILIGCTNMKTLDDITKFSVNGNYKYLLFHFIDPTEKDGYILEINENGDKENKIIIEDPYLAPSDIFWANNKYYFASGGYSCKSDILTYDPSNGKFEVVNTNQNEFIDKIYANGSDLYLTTLIDKLDSNRVYNINNGESINSKEGYFIEHIAVLDEFIITVSSSLDSTHNKIIKYNKEFVKIDEITIRGNINRFSYSSENSYLYLFKNNIEGEIVRIDSNLNMVEYKINEYKDCVVKYSNIVEVKKDTILAEVKIESNDCSESKLIEIRFNNDVQVKNIDINSSEKIVNIDYDSNELFTRYYENKKAIIRIRSLENYELKDELIMKNDDPIFFMDNISLN